MRTLAVVTGVRLDGNGDPAVVVEAMTDMGQTLSTVITVDPDIADPKELNNYIEDELINRLGEAHDLVIDKTVDTIRIFNVAGSLDSGPNRLVEEDGATYLVYTALLNQSGIAEPVATVQQNTLGGELVWTYLAGGHYVGTLAGAFLVNKVWFSPSSITLSDGSQFLIQRRTDNAVEIFTADDILVDLPVEIRVYP